jgi:uncharacterized membrane protein (UPF0182 family)
MVSLLISMQSAAWGDWARPSSRNRAGLGGFGLLNYRNRRNPAFGASHIFKHSVQELVMRLPRFALLLILAVFVSLGTLLGLYADWLWFLSVGYGSVFSTMLLTSVGLGVAAFLVSFGFLYGNVRVARSRALGHVTGKGGRKAKAKVPAPRGPAGGILLACCLLFSLMIGLAFSGWDVVLKFLNGASFGTADPVFGMDIGFYMFSLPLYWHAFSFALVVLAAGLLAAFITYLAYSARVRSEMEPWEGEGSPRIGLPSYSVDMQAVKSRSLPQMSVLFFLLFLVMGSGFWLAQYGILFSTAGVVKGAGYTDLNVGLPFIYLLSILSVVVAFVFLANMRMNRWRLSLEALAVFAAVAVIGLVAVGVVQGFVVKPDEFNMERPYLERNIQATLEAYGLGSVEERAFPLEYSLTAADIERNDATISNVRLWDWRPLGKTYQQLQLFRTYYEFPDIDIDRYQFDGTYKQVMLSAREMNTDNLASNARTWVNTHLVFTHGYGIVMNPVDRVTSEGLPEFFVKDIPPKSDYMNITVPGIYYGQERLDYAVVKTTTEELDYPMGDQNVFASYEGSGGVSIGDLGSRLAFAAKAGSIELLVSNSLTPESRILLYRNVDERVREIAPFLMYDSDPYIVADEGRLFWIMDGYTASDSYPYSERTPIGRWQEINYIRNSVKVVVDAYNGNVSFYVIDGSDPVIRTYMGIFPELFRSFSEMPEGLKEHLRYPEGLFIIQKEVYSVYHMRNPNVFYNKEDVWVTPYEILQESKQEMIPYYLVMKLPGEESEEFILLMPFTPRGKDNLVAWMAAKSDFPNYGNITVFAFSKQELAYGPLQIEARIDQDTEISQQFTLWSQSGSSVFRGNTLVIPIENSILYVEPIYLEATEQGTLPELKRVIVAYGNRVTMKPTLGEAISEIFGTQAPQPPPGQPPETPEETLQRITELYQSAQEALTSGDLGLYAQYMGQIGELLGIG